MTKARSPVPTRYTIDVTETDIERAHKDDSYKCVVAQAIARAVPEATNVDVDTQTIRFTRGSERLVYLTPPAVMGYVIAFDAGDPIEPFRFSIRNPRRTRRRVLTEKGKEVQRQRDIKRGQKRRHTVREHLRGGKKPRHGEESTQAALIEATTQRVPDDGGRGETPKRVFKTKRRSYGHRLLRINQEDGK